MIKYIINNKKDWLIQKKNIMGINQEKASQNKKPYSYPCIAIVAYLGEGQDEIDFIYQKDLIKNKR